MTLLPFRSRLTRTPPLPATMPSETKNTTLVQRPVRQGNTAAWRFFLLVFGLSGPFYLIGLAGWRMPGLPMLPLSALMGFLPMLAALILVGRSGGWSAASQFTARLFDGFSLAGLPWLCMAFALMPLVCLIEYFALWQMGVVLPAVNLTIGSVIFLFAAFFLGAIGEELGWQGYAYGALRRRHHVLVSALILGTVWAVWHVIPFAQLGRGNGWILWHSLSAVALRIIIVWLYESAGSRVLIAVIFHAMINLCWAVFPEEGSLYDPFVTLLILTPLAAIIAIVWRKGQS